MPKFRFVYQELEEYIGDLEGNQIDISEDGLILIQKLNHITNQEMEEFYNGNLDMRITKIKNIVWFTFQFGNSGWGEAPFSLHLAQLDHKASYIDHCNVLRVAIIDTENGRIAGLLEIKLSQVDKFLLKKYIDATYSMPFSKESYFSELLSVQSQYSIEQIASASMPMLNTQ